MEAIKSMCFATIGCSLLTAQANAFVISDVYDADANVITNAEYLATIPEIPFAFAIFEDYAEIHRVPYAFHDGLGIVNAEGNFFDTIVAPEAADTGEWTLVFEVTNTTPYSWSDYHFEFWDPGFNIRLSDFPLVVSSTVFPTGPWTNEIFLNSAFDGSSLSFWGPDEQDAGVTNRFSLTMDLDQISGSFGIRQVATTVPEPGTLAVFGIEGVGVMVMQLRKRRMKGCV